MGWCALVWLKRRLKRACGPSQPHCSALWMRGGADVVQFARVGTAEGFSGRLFDGTDTRTRARTHA